MSTTVQYKGNTLATVSNNTKTLKTAGKYMEGDVVLTDVSGGSGAISVVDTLDANGGTIRTITAVDISDTTAVANDVAQGKYFYTADGTKTEGTSTGGGGGGGDSATIKGLIDRTITEIDLPNDLTKIGEYAFYKCRLESITLPNTVTSIESRAFASCTTLSSVTFSSSLSSIGYGAFSGCTDLNITTLPSSVTTISSYAFASCSGITNIYCDGVITSLGTSAFLSDSTNISMNIVEAKFPNLSQSNISTVFGSSTSSYACKKLQVADVGKISTISANAFANCYALQTLVLRRTEDVVALSNVSAFLNTPLRGRNSKTGTVYVPSALISTYRTATNWSTLYNNGTVTFVAIEGSGYEL